MHEPDFWTNCAEAMELSLEGNRLIADELKDLLCKAWRRTLQSIAVWLNGTGARWHQPPV